MTFDEAWRHAEPVAGWLTREQARVLWDAAQRLPAGATAVEIGSHQGRSTVVLGQAARERGAAVTAVDPFLSGRLLTGGDPVRAAFEKNIADAGLADVVTLVPLRSADALDEWHGPVDLLYIDGKHDVVSFLKDVRWTRHMAAGGEVLVHDCFSSIGVTLGVLVGVLPRGRLAYVDRVGSMARFRVGPAGAAGRLRAARELPWFARNVLVKVLLRLRLSPVARALGHHGRYDPY